MVPVSGLWLGAGLGLDAGGFVGWDCGSDAEGDGDAGAVVGFDGVGFGDGLVAAAAVAEVVAAGTGDTGMT